MRYFTIRYWRKRVKWPACLTRSTNPRHPIYSLYIPRRYGRTEEDVVLKVIDQLTDWWVGVAYSRTGSKVPRAYAKCSDSSSECLWSKLREALTVPRGMWLLLGSSAHYRKVLCILAMGPRRPTITDPRHDLPRKIVPPAPPRTKVKRGVEIINREDIWMAIRSCSAWASCLMTRASTEFFLGEGGII